MMLNEWTCSLCNLAHQKERPVGHITGKASNSGNAGRHCGFQDASISKFLHLFKISCWNIAVRLQHVDEQDSKEDTTQSI